MLIMNNLFDALSLKWENVNMLQKLRKKGKTDKRLVSIEIL